jgi:hypothetical protein
LAGPAAGPNGGTIYIDGFSGGELPPKNTIREIRINQNPFSPEYDRLRAHSRSAVAWRRNWTRKNKPVLDAVGQPVLVDVSSIESYRRTLFFQRIGLPAAKSGSWAAALIPRRTA